MVELNGPRVYLRFWLSNIKGVMKVVGLQEVVIYIWDKKIAASISFNCSLLETHGPSEVIVLEFFVGIFLYF
jgi:hypothetical protein